MVMETGGLDAQVEQRMDAYRGNPQQLQQRYGQNKELLDLLALQKLTSEKQAAARDMQMKMQQQPGTIAQQREQEALELTKQEMGGTLGELARRTKGTLDQKQMQQQQNMGKMAQAAARPQMGNGAGLASLMGGAARPQPTPAVPPQAQGLAAARMAQGPSKFAGGGIVSFAAGDSVRGERLAFRTVHGPSGLYYGEMSAQQLSALANAGNRVASEVLTAQQARVPAPSSAPPQAAASETSTPFGRWWRKTTSEIGEDAALEKLRAQVRSKYAAFGAPIGALRNQSDEQRQYAQNVLANIDSLGAEQLVALSAADFNSGLTPEAVSALPMVASQPVTTTADAPDAGGPVDPASAMPTVAPITYEARAPYQTEMSQLPESVLNVPAVSPIAPSRDRVDAAQDDLLSTLGAMPEPLDVSLIEFSELTPVSADRYLDEEALAARDALLNKAQGDIGADPQAALEAARASTDEYTRRGANQQVSAEQLAREQAFINRTMDPKRVAQRQRMETFGGGAKYGRGGIGQAFIESQDRSDLEEAGGLALLREIQQAGINNDMTAVGYGSIAGESAASRAQADNVNAANIFGNEVTRARDAATVQQTALQNVNTANTNAQNAASLAQYRAEVEAINNEAAARREILASEAQSLSDQTKLAVSSADNEQDALIASAQAAVEQAKESDAFQLELEKINQLDEENAVQLYYDQLNKLREDKTAILDADINAIALRNAVATAETDADLESAEKAFIAYEDAMENILAQRFAFDYAKLTELGRRVEDLRSQRISAQLAPGPLEVGDPNITVEPVP
jgi:hypothetical protein